MLFIFAIINMVNDMNNKGMAMTTMIYLSVILFSLLLITTLSVVSTSYTNKHDLIKKTSIKLNECIGRGDC